MFMYFRQIWGTILLAEIVLCQDNIGGGTDTSLSTSQFEDTVINSVLRIVDNKFDTLSERITSLERAINSLQYYNIRQFRQVTSHLTAVDTILQATHTQMGQLDIESRAIKIELNVLKHKVDGFQQVNSAMYEAIEQYVVHLDEQIGEQVNGLHQSLQGFFNESSNKNKSENVNNCTEVLDLVEEKFKLLINKTEELTENLTCTSIDNANDEKESRLGIVRVLTTLNDNVVQSLNFHRHTGNLIERVVATTDNVRLEQKLIRSDIQELENCRNVSRVPVTNFTCVCPDIDSDNTTTIDNSHETINCLIPRHILSELRGVSKNNTDLLETLSDIAQLSRASLKSSAQQLHSDFHQDEPINKPFAHTDNAVSDFMSLDLETLVNKTEGIFRIVEAVAANTGWIPHIFHNLMFVENQVNKTLNISHELVSRLLKLTLHVVENIMTSNDVDRKSYVFGKALPIPAPPTNKPEMFHTEYSVLKELLQNVQQTTIKINRIIPGLTQLVSEPEPLVTLVDGKKDNEGRVEIYSQGRWGTICDNLGHIEATYICRRLGYTGGVAVARGHFGAGQGIFWKLNVTCLYEMWCDAATPVPETEPCEHRMDFSVVCDNMVRLSVTVASDDVIRNLGGVQLHHNAMWIPVCADNWGKNETTVVCHQLGFQQGATLDPQNITVNAANIWVVQTKCTGGENRLSACQHNFSKHCIGNTIATIVCD